MVGIDENHIENQMIYFILFFYDNRLNNGNREI